MIIYTPLTTYNGSKQHIEIPKLFTPLECESIINQETRMEISLGSTLGSKSDPDYRKSEIAWLYEKDWSWMYDRLKQMVIDVNKVFKFELMGFNSPIQYTIYDANKFGNDARYDYHQDMGLDEVSYRKLSISVQLSDPNTYKGGELTFKISEEENYASKEQGTVVVFPSWVLHKVRPVTYGIRRSLVAWIGGPHFK